MVAFNVGWFLPRVPSPARLQNQFCIISVDNMDSARANVVGKLIDAVRSHYETSSNPLYLSRFGQTNTELRSLILSNFSSIGAAIRDAGLQYLEIVSPRHKAGGEIVVTPDVKEVVLTKLDDLFSDYSAAEQAFDKLPLPVRVAFCVRVEDNQQVMICLKPRFRFERIKRGLIIKDNFYLLDDKYRHPGINLHEATPADKLNLWRSFDSWRQAHSLDMKNFEKNVQPVAAVKTTDVVDDELNALTRLIHAQDPDVRRKLIIPADIALLLLGGK